MDGRSQVVSWDVFETVEGALPSFIEPFFSGDNIGEFLPRGPEDQAYAEQATEYVNYIMFLSCLCGSERCARRPGPSRQFLSCLCGSELHRLAFHLCEAFLSCLCGSEPGRWQYGIGE